jgi:ribosome maturation factor RimP
MSSAKTQVLTAIIEPVVESFGLQLWGLQYSSHNGHSLLRIFIDGEQGVGVDDCAKVSRQLSAVLDVEDPINGKYILEVSSPGLDRSLFTLAQYTLYVGSTIKVKLNTAVDMRKKFKGILLAVAVDQQSIELEVEGKVISIAYLNIDKANVVIDLP